MSPEPHTAAPSRLEDMHCEGDGASGTSLDRLVALARAGDPDAWKTIVERHRALVRSIARRHRLCREDAEDVSQSVWVKLFEHIDGIREPRALPGWIAVTAARECGRVVSLRNRTVSVDPQVSADFDRVASAELTGAPASELDEAALRAEDQQAVRAGLQELPSRDRQLLVLLVADPPVPYAVISQRLGMPVGSIGPTRARSLRKLRHTRPVRLVTDHSTAA